MSLAEMDRLVNAYTSDASLRTTLASATDLDDAAEIARSAGYDVTADEATTYMTNLQSDAQAELSTTQLDAVAGGKHHGPNMSALMGNSGQQAEGYVNDWINSYK